MKRLVSLLLCLSLILSFMPMTVIAAGEDWKNNYELRLQRNKAEFAKNKTDPESLKQYLMEPTDPQMMKKVLEITRPCETEYQKAIAIYAWVVDNFYYDWDDFLGIRPPTRILGMEDILAGKGVGVCIDYANLTCKMLQYAGIPAKVRTGYVRTLVWEAHAWNEAYVDGRWIILEPTGDSWNDYMDDKYHTHLLFGSFDEYGNYVMDFQKVRDYKGDASVEGISETYYFGSAGSDPESAAFDSNDRVFAAPDGAYYEAFVTSENMSFGDIGDGMVIVGSRAPDGEYYRGYADASGKLVIPCQYEDAVVFSEGIALVKSGGKWGAIDKTGKKVVDFIYDYAYKFSSGLAPVKSGGLMGYVDKTGRLAVPLKYQDARMFQDGMARVKRDDKWGYIDATGKEVVPCQYSSAWDFSEGLGEVCDYSTRKWGYVDKTGKLVVPCEYDDPRGIIRDRDSDMAPSKEGLIRVRKGDKYGFIDHTGKVVVPLIYSAAGNFSEGLAKVGLDGKEGFIDKTGKVVIPLQFVHASDFNSGFSLVELPSRFGYADKNGNFYDFTDKAYRIEEFKQGFAKIYINEKDKGWGLVDMSLQTVAPNSFRNIEYDGTLVTGSTYASDDQSSFQSHMMRVRQSGSPLPAPDSKTKRVEKKEMIDHGSYQEYPCPTNSRIHGDPQEGMMICVFSDKYLYGFMDTKGNLVVPCQFSDVNPYKNGMARVKSGDRFGYVNKTGELAVPCIYYEAYDFGSNGLAEVRLSKDSGWGYVDRTGKMTIPAQYSYTEPFRTSWLSSDYAIVADGGSYYGINDKGAVIGGEKNKFSSYFSFREGLAAVRRDGKYGFISTAFDMRIPLEYDRAVNFSEGLAPVQKNGKWGYINKSGKLVTPCIYDWALEHTNGMGLVSQNGKWGYVNKDGQLVVTCEYDKAYDFSQEMGMVWRGRKVGFVNKSGDLVVPCKYDWADNFSAAGLPEKFTYIDNKSSIVQYRSMAGLAVVRRDGKYGYVDRFGNERINCEYTDAIPFSGGLAAVKDGGDNWILINGTQDFSVKDSKVTDGWSHSSNYPGNVAHANIRPFSEGRAAVSNNDLPWHFIDTNGESAETTEYFEVSDYHNGYAVVSLRGGGYNGLIDRDGKIIIPCKYGELSDVSDDGICRYIDSSGSGFFILPVNKQPNATVESMYVFMNEDPNLGYSNSVSEMDAYYIGGYYYYQLNDIAWLITINKRTDKHFGIHQETGKGVSLWTINETQVNGGFEKLTPAYLTPTRISVDFLETSYRLYSVNGKLFIRLEDVVDFLGGSVVYENTSDNLHERVHVYIEN